MSRPLVSVVIPAYNSAGTIAVALADLMRQTWEPLEIVVVDDGSADGTAEVAARVCPEAVIVRQENRGLVGARNTGWRAAGGEYIAFLDDDDGCHPRRVEAQMEVLTGREGTALVMTGRLEVRPATTVVPRWHATGGLTEHSSRDLLRLTRRGPGASMLLSRLSLDRLGGFRDATPGLGSVEDELLVRACAIGQVMTLRRPLYRQFISAGSRRWRWGPEEYAGKHFLWLDPWVRGSVDLVPKSQRLAGIASAAREGLLRRCLWRAWRTRDGAFIHAALSRLSAWGGPSAREKAIAAGALAALRLRR